MKNKFDLEENLTLRDDNGVIRYTLEIYFVITPNLRWKEKTFDHLGNELTYKDSEGFEYNNK